MDIPSYGSQSKLLSTDLVNTNNYYIIHSVHNSFAIKRSINVNPLTKPCWSTPSTLTQSGAAVVKTITSIDSLLY